MIRRRDFLAEIGLPSGGVDQREIAPADDTGSASDACIHELFEAQAQRAPHRVAVTCEDAQLTYGELDARANLLAGRLRQVGVGPDVLVAVCLDRSLEMVVAILAVLKAGGAYVPLDPEYPELRLAAMLEDVKPKTILTRSTLHKRLPPHEAETILLDTLDWRAAPRAARLRPERVSPDNLAYCIFTSGSTGRPKGVLVTHRNVTRLFRATDAWFGFNADDVWTIAHSFSFDFSVWELWGALFYGGKTIVVPAATARSPEALHRLLIANSVTVLNTTPSAFYPLIDADADSRVRASLRLRYVVFGGEALEFRRLSRWFARYGERTRLVNMYGITETTVHVTYHPVTPNALGGASIIGVPIPDLQVHILDENSRPVASGETGEMYIGGAGVARGYLNRPEQTAERFIPDTITHTPGARLYRSGDLARLLPDGKIEFRGRADYQVKLRGYRIELGDIEAAITDYPGVHQSVVVLRDAPGHDKQLIAYLRADPDAEVTRAALRADVARRLPEYMVPAAFVILDTWPLTANNKIDRAALPEPQREDSGVERPFVAPRTPTEIRVAAIWSAALALERVGVHDEFFALGGHSLMAARICTELREEFRVPLGIGELVSGADVARLARRIDELRAQAEMPSPVPLRPVSRDGALPTAWSQRQVMFLHQLAPDSLAYNNQVTMRLRGQLDIPTLERALAEIVRRHESMRTTFEIADGEWRQVIHPPWPVRLTPIDDAPGLLAELLRHRFDPGRLPLVQWSLIRVAPDEHVFVHLEHHLIHDGWSFGVFLRELSALYAAFHQGQPSPLPELPVQFADFTVWQRDMLRGATLTRLLNHWQAKLTGPLPALELQTDRTRPSRQSFRGAEIMLDLPQPLATALRALARRHNSSLFAVMLAAFYALLRRYTGQDDIVLGSGFANRQQKGTETLIGMVLNILPMRADLSGDPSLAEAIERTQAVVQDALEHQELPFDLLVEHLSFKRDPSRNPLFQLAFNFHDAQVPVVRWPGLSGEISYPHAGFAKFDMNVIVIPWAEQRIGTETPDERITLKWDYNTDLYDAATVERMVGHYRHVLEAAVADAKQRLSEIELTDEAERLKLLVEWNDTARPYPKECAIQELFEAEVARAPDATAVEFEGETLSYGELNRRANRLAHHLRAAGVGPEVKVALCIERSIEMVVALLGILKAGGAYVPLDPEYPSNRLRFLLEDTKAPILVTRSNLRDRLPAVAKRTICIDLEAEAIAGIGDANPASGVTPASLAYIMYTSGSTGTPKGVCVEHRGVVRLVKNTNYAALGPDEVLLHISPFSFDASTFELWGALLNGAKVVVYKPGVPRLDELAQTIRDRRITVLWATTALFHELVDAHLETLAGVRQILAGGEAMSAPHARRMLAALPATHRFANCYGPTENTTFTTFYPMTRETRIGRSVPIGRPIANTRVYILDSEMRPAPIGVAGELYAAGDGLSRGYLNQPDLRAERFVANPLSYEPGARLYRTGDIARYLSDGNIEFLGRRDTQVKLHGFRIELGEIDSVLTEHPDVRRAATLIRDDERQGKRLIAYLEGRADPEALRRFLRSRLPAYMIPASFVAVDALPLNAHAKVDHQALLARGDVLDHERRAPAVAPRTAIERALFEIWTKRFGHDRFGVEDGFFDIGGHSLLAASIFADIEVRFGVALPLALLYEASTIAALALHVDNHERGISSNIVPIQRAGRKTPIFAISGAGGSAIVFAPLAKELGPDQPLFGLEAPGVSDDAAPSDRIEDIAEALLAQMRDLDLTQPRVLMGACSGALVAYELACRLAAEGRPVEHVVMVDPSPTGAQRRRSLVNNPLVRRLILPRFMLERLGLYLRNLLVLSGDERRRFLREKSAVLGEILRTGDLLRGSRQEIAQNRVLEATAAALKLYSPRPYAGPVALILGERFARGEDGIDWSHWKDLCTGRFDVERIPGSSTGVMFREPLVATLAHRIEGSILKKA